MKNETQEEYRDRMGLDWPPMRASDLIVALAEAIAVYGDKLVRQDGYFAEDDGRITKVVVDRDGNFVLYPPQNP